MYKGYFNDYLKFRKYMLACSKYCDSVIEYDSFDDYVYDQPSIDINDAYKEDYEEPVSKDYVDGFADGYAQGFEDGADSGYDEGYNDGWDDCEEYYDIDSDW